MADKIIQIKDQEDNVYPEIRNNIKSLNYAFTNLTQYSPSGYYLCIRDIKTKTGIPSNAKIISASLSGWSDMSTNVSVNLAGDDVVLVMYASGHTITTASRVTIWFNYI